MRSRAILGASLALLSCGGAPSRERARARAPEAAKDAPKETAPSPPRVGALLFRAPGFPTVDAPAIDDATLDQATLGLRVERATTVAALEARLRTNDVAVLVLPYGSAF